MSTQVVMPQLGESVVEGTVSRWLKQEGDPVAEYEPLLEVSTDKVDSEIPAPAEGVLLRIFIPEGTTVERGTLLAVIGAPGDPIPDAPITHGQTTAHEPEPASEPQAAAVPAPAAAEDSAAHVTPVVARMVAEHKLDLRQITGTGRGGRVTKKDVEAFLEGRGASAAAAEEDLPPWEQPGSGDLFKPTVDYGDDAELTPAPVAKTPAPPPAALAPTGQVVPLSTMRRRIAEHMVQSRRTSPHVTTVFEVDLSAVMAHRAANRDAFARQNANLTLTAYFAAAAVTALRGVPIINARWTDDGILMQPFVNLGIAVALDDGLIVPVIRNAHELNLLGLARAVNDRALRAREGKLAPDEAQGGTFTITNHGVSGSLFAMPIINQPQVGILGVGALEKRVKVIEDAHGGDMIAIRPCAYISLTFDHRVADGASGDAFMRILKQTLEGWRD